MKISIFILSLTLCHLVFSQSGPFFGPQGEVSFIEEAIPEEIILEEEFTELLTEEEGVLPGGYIPLNVTEASQDPQIQGFLYIGVQYVVQQGIQNGDIPNSFYQVSEIYSIESQVVTGVNYRFHVQLSDNQGNNANVTFVVNYQEETGQTEVTAYSFEKEGQPSDEWIELNVTEASTDPKIQGFLYSGTQYVVQQGISEGTLPNAFYQVNEIYSIATRETQEGEDYKFEVQLSDGQSNTPNVSFIVSYNTETSATKVTNYTIEGGSTSGPGPSEYTPLDPSLATTDPEIQGFLYFGTQYVIQQGISEGTLPNSFYQVGEVYSLANKTEDQNEYYKFDISITDNQQNSANTTFEVRLDPTTNTKEVTSYSFSNVVTSGQGNGTTNPPEEPWVPMDLQQVSQDETILLIGAYGFAYVVQQGIDSGTLPSSTYQPTVVYSLEQQQASNGINYRWNLEAADELGNSAHIIYITFYDPISTYTEVTSYEFVNVVRAF